MTDIAMEKGLPINVDAERVLLGAIMLQDSNVGKLGLEVDDFGLEKHRRIYRRMKEMYELGETIDRVTLADQLIRYGELASVDGLTYLTQLDDGLPKVVSIDSYARIVKEKSVLRQTIHRAQHLMNECFTAETSASELLSTAARDLMGLNTFTSKLASETPGSVVDNYTGGIDAFLRPPRGMSCGFTKVDDVLYGLQPETIYVIGADTSVGKAQPLDSLVKTPHGWTAMGDLRVADKLASIDGAPSRVVAIHERGTLPCFRITFQDGRQTYCAGDHLWKIRHTHSGKQEWKTVSTLELQRLVGLPSYKSRIGIPTASGDFGSHAKLPIAPWLLGLLLGDGCITKGTPSFTSADKQIVRRARRILRPLGYSLNPTGRYGYRIARTGGANKKGVSGVMPNGIAEELKALGLFGSDCFSKFIPSSYLEAGRDSRMELLRGLLDSDGTVGKNHALTFSTSSSRLAKGVQLLAWSLGAVATVKPKQPRFRHKGEHKVGALSNTIVITHPDKGAFVSLRRKKVRLKLWKSRRLHRLTVMSVEPDGERTMRCITVSHPTGLYLTNDYVVTHNSSLALQIAFQIANTLIPVLYCSLEMSKEALVRRLISGESGVALHEIMAASADMIDLDRMKATHRRIADLPLYIDDDPYCSALGFGKKIEQHIRQHKIKLAVLDYLQIMDWQGKGSARFKDEREALSFATKQFKQYAKEFGIPIIEVSQLSRTRARSSKDLKPKLRDLHGSSTIEKDADAVMLIYRAELDDPSRKELRGRAELTVAKNRNGPLGTVHMRFLGEYTKFEESDPPEPEGKPEK